jgi:uncharacterized protein (DUF433 family)
MASIVRDPEIRSGNPRVEGTRITVIDIKRRVIDGDEDPFTVASEYEIEISAVFEALAYFYENAEEMRERENKREQQLGEIRQQSSRLRRQIEESGVADGQ